MTDSFTRYMESVENPKLAAGNLDYIVHDSPEGGTQTVGFGHKLNLIEKETRQIHGLYIDELDLEKCRLILDIDLGMTELGLSQKVPMWRKRSNRQKEILLDYEYNLGSVARVFPKFYTAVLRRDIEGQREEYKRHYRDSSGYWRELEDRNKLFYARYLSESALKGFTTL